MKNVAPQNQQISPNREQNLARLYVAAIPDALAIVSHCLLILTFMVLAVEYLR